jgi:hypothetical protein
MSFTQRVISGSAADGEYVYYNATIINNNVVTTQTTDDPTVYFQDTRQYPLIKDTSQYVVSVDSLSINGAQKSLPIFVPQIVVGSDPNLTIYSVSFGLQLQAAGTGTGTGTVVHKFLATVPITWVPENQASFTVVPASATPRQAETNYYYCYTYQHWLDLMNNALTAAWRDVMYKANLHTGYGGTRCPFFEYDATTGLFSLCQDAITCWLPYGQTVKTPSQVQASTGTGTGTSNTQGVSDPTQPFSVYFPTTTTAGQGVGTATGTGTGTGFQSCLYGGSEFSFVGFNSNLEGLITNLDAVYFGGNSNPFGTNANSFGYTQTSSTVLAPSAVQSSGGWVLGNTATVYYPENIINVIPRPNDFFTLPTPFASAYTTPPIYYIRETQDYISTGSLWSPVASLVLVTTQIPVRFEQMANPVDIGQSNSGGATGLSGASQKVLLETPIDAVTADLWRGYILYKPLIPLFSALDPSEGGLMNLDVRLMWRSRLTNELIPFQLYNSGTVSFRLRFVRK